MPSASLPFLQRGGVENHGGRWTGSIYASLPFPRGYGEGDLDAIANGGNPSAGDATRPTQPGLGGTLFAS